MTGIMEDAPRNPTTRFSDRVDNYVKYRPSYPLEVIDALKSHCGLTPSTIVADIGSGTGILTRLLLQNGNHVLAVEPNLEMRVAAERLLVSESGFESRDGSAEETGLANGSVDLIVAAQAFHWFDRELSKKEFRRILRPGGWIVLIWNERETETSEFLAAYESLLEQHTIDYQRVNHTNITDDVLSEFFKPGIFETLTFRNSQRFDFEGLKGRCMSSSYIPNEGQPGHERMISSLEEIFDRYQTEGWVEFEYRTNLYLSSFLPER
ncbi:MAG: class I SAM-dependent methyltransferase [Luteolibacter sp.]|uniref:class I SAM-dependent methyltransferase n=1 Tax=Luteolibacter sp. TaxID=1962973 RepID=UPI0032635705